MDDSSNKFIISPDDQILLTGSSGFVGRCVVGNLLERGFEHIRCLVRATSNCADLIRIIQSRDGADRVDIVQGNLLSRDDCLRITHKARIIYHLAAGTGTKSFSEAFLNSVITTRNLVEASLKHGCLIRLVNVSSFAVYTNMNKTKGRILDETCSMETSPQTRAEAYCYGKTKQDELVIDYGQKSGLPYVIVRPGIVYGPGKSFIPGRVGINMFGMFLHLGGSNRLPLSYVENCAEAIVLAGLIPGLEGEVLNIVDDDLPTSRVFLREYKKNVTRFKSLYVPKPLSFLFCVCWEKLSRWSRGQIPPVFTYREWMAYWKKTCYSNDKLKKMTNWKPRVSTAEGLKLFFEYCREISRLQ